MGNAGRAPVALLAAGVGILVAFLVWHRTPPAPEPEAPQPPAAVTKRRHPSEDPRVGLPRARPPEPSRRDHEGRPPPRRELTEAARRELERVREENRKRNGIAAPPEEYTPEQAAERFPSPYNDGNPFKMEYR